jgi:hypothetical protein
MRGREEETVARNESTPKKERRVWGEGGRGRKRGGKREGRGRRGRGGEERESGNVVGQYWWSNGQYW